MTSIYSLTIFTSAFLLFLIQPMISKLLLPHLGGSPAVWNTSMMFFQTLLLLGYGYAHLSAKFLGAGKQFWLHLLMLAISLAWLPIAAQTDLGFLSVEYPIRWVLLSLFLSVGFPFFVLAANAPLLQYWLSRTSHKDAADPYFLYSASNAGSLIALLSYPFIIEPLLTLYNQTLIWSALFGVFVLLIVLCGQYMKRHLVSAQKDAAAITPAQAPTWRSRLYWIALAFCPSSLLLGVTTYITTDIASMPLFWVIPLAIYLLTFIFAFAKNPILADRAFDAQVVIVPFVIMAIAFQTNFINQVMLLHLFAFFYIAMGCHGLLAKNKPDVRYLTEFFLWVSLGGMLGGVFNSLVAPVIFPTPIEYALALVLSLFLRPYEGSFARPARERLLDIAVPLVFAFFLWGSITGYGYFQSEHADSAKAIDQWLTSLLPEDYSKAISLSLLPILAVLLFVILSVMASKTRRRPIRFALVIAALPLVVPLAEYKADAKAAPSVLYSERNFFGVNRVVHVPESKAMLITHGTTLHGIQSLEEEFRLQPVSYYQPLKEVFAHLSPNIKNSPVAVLGLGSGSLSCFGRKRQVFDFYEIDPAVASIAQNPEYFTFLRDCGPEVSVIMGDGRLSLASAPAQHYGAVVIDVFSSDAIPMHLLTREALQLYKERLAPNGILMFNISNRHLKLGPVMAALAEDVGLKALIRYSMNPPGKLDRPSIWVLMAHNMEDFNHLAQHNPDWKELHAEPGTSVWTDNYSNILSMLF